MMGRLKSEQGQLFYQFNLEDAVPDDHLVRKIDTALDLSWLRSELAPHYSSMGRPSNDPDAGGGICLCDPLGTADLPRSAGEPCLSVVLQTRYRRHDSGSFGIFSGAALAALQFAAV